MKIEKIIVLICVLVLCMAVCNILPIHGEEKIYESVVRLHVLANSDSDEDQALKLKVRDAILGYTSPKVIDSKTREEAIEILQSELDEIEKIAEQVVKEQGYKGIYIQQEGTERREDIPVPEPLVSDFQTIQLIAFMRDIAQRTNVFNYTVDSQFSAACKKIEEYVTDLVDLLYDYEAKNQLLFYHKVYHGCMLQKVQHRRQVN